MFPFHFLDRTAIRQSLYCSHLTMGYYNIPGREMPLYLNNFRLIFHVWRNSLDKVLSSGFTTGFSPYFAAHTAYSSLPAASYG